MFADSFCDSSWAIRSLRGWTTLISFAVQAVVLESLLLLPLFFTAGLPRPQWMAHLVAPARTSTPLAAAVETRSLGSGFGSLSLNRPIMTPSRIPRTISTGEEATPPTIDSSLVGGAGTGPGTAVFSSIGTGANALAPPPAPPALRPLRVSRVMEGNLIHRVQPEYPALAKMARVQGAVVLHAVISKQGTIEGLEVISGPPALVGAAVDAVRQWRYRPYYLNDEPVEVDTQVTVNFVLAGA
jgi:periplasmic protein TonB